MKILDENITIKDEVLFPCRVSSGYGIVIAVKSKDRGTIGSIKNPAFAYLLTTSLKEIAKFEITEKIPKNILEIRWHKTTSIPENYASKIVKWANSTSKNGNNNWKLLQSMWDAFQPN